MGPFEIKLYLANTINKEWDEQWPCESNAVYLVSEHRWEQTPTDKAHVLYIGSNTGTSSRFVTRIGDLIADMYGFYGEKTGHHSGGQTLWQWCNHRQIHPGDLWLAWAKTTCTRCAELHLYTSFSRAQKNDFNEHGLRNKNSPPACKLHNSIPAPTN